MTKTNRRHLFRNKGNFVYNFKLKRYEHMSQTPMRGNFHYLQSIKKTYLSMSLNKKYFIYYCRTSVKEGLNTDLKTSELMLGNYDKGVYQKCKHCHCVIEIKKAFKENAFICNMCFKLLQNQDKINPQIHIIWTENQKYRVFTNFHHSLLDNLFRRENIKTNVAKFHKKLLNFT